MKVKLLRKVRKRYEIVKVTSVGANTDNWHSHNEWAKKLGLPFFILRDNDDALGLRTGASKELDTAMIRMSAWIKLDYAKTKKTKTIEEKVWYPKQHK